MANKRKKTVTWSLALAGAFGFGWWLAWAGLLDTGGALALVAGAMAAGLLLWRYL